MKKYIITILSVVGVGLIVAGASASSLILSPSNISSSAGKTFKVTITAGPSGATVYTVKADLRFPSDLLEVTSFTIGSSWMPLTQSGYDKIDNQNGALIKTAGYPNGLTGNLVFGSVTFKMKKAGSGAITIGKDSLILDSSSANVLTSSNSTVAFSAPIPAVTVAPTATAKASTSKPEAIISVTPEPPVSVSPEIAQEEVPTRQASIYATVKNLIRSPIFYGILLAIIIVLAIYTYIHRKDQKTIE